MLTRLDNAGNKSSTVFDVDGLLTAVQNVNSFGSSVRWTHVDPMGLSEAGDTKSVFDPMGNYIVWQHAPVGPPPNAYPPSAASFGGLGPSFGYAINSACILDGIPTDCSLALNMLSNGSAAQCRNNDCGPIHYADPETGNGAWLIPNGSGFWASDGSDSDWLDPDDVRYGSAFDSYATSFNAPQKQKRKGRTRRPRRVTEQARQEPEYPPVTSSEINIVYGGQQFQYVQDDVVSAIVDIANRQRCSDAFKKYNLTIPYDVVKSRKLRVAGTAALYQPNASELLGWTDTQVADAKAVFQREDRFFRPSYTADLSYPRVPTVVFNALQIRQGRFGGLKAVVTHAFMHLGGQAGNPNATPHDLANFKGYDEILNACR